MNTRTIALNRHLARALSLPPDTVRAVLTLEAGELPKLEITTLVRDRLGAPVPATDGQQLDQSVEERIRRIPFILRLEPCADIERTLP